MIKRWLVASLILAALMTALAAMNVLGFWYTGSVISAFLIYWLIAAMATAFLLG